MVKIEQENGKNKKQDEKKSALSLNVSLSLIRKARQNRHLKALAAYYLLKEKYKNSCIYGFRSRMKEIAEDLQICEKTLYTYLDHLRRYDLVSEHCGNLVMVSTAKIKAALKDRKIARITISENESIATIETRLAAKLIEDHRNRVMKATQIDLFEKKHLKGKRNSDPHNMTVGESGSKPNAAFKPSISIRNIAKVLKVSAPKAIQLKRQMNDLGIIKSHPSPRIAKAYGIPKHSLKHAEDLPGYFYVAANGFLYTTWGDRHEFIEHPAHLTELTYKRYSAIMKWRQKQKANNRVMNEL